MKTTEKRFQTTVIVTYSKSKSNTTRKVSFDTFEEAKAVVEEQRIKHPRSKKFNGYVFDSVEKKSILI
jgi:hypothetical protein